MSDPEDHIVARDFPPPRSAGLRKKAPTIRHQGKRDPGREPDTGKEFIFTLATVAGLKAERFEGAAPIAYGPTMRDIPILYSFRRCPYAMRARMALIASGTVYAHREVLLREKPPAMLAVSPKATVPVLVQVNGEVIDESIDIMRWALAQHDPEGWLVRDDALLIAKFDDAFKHHLDRYKYAGRYDADPLVHRAAGLEMLVQLGRRLAEQDYLAGAARGLVDIALFPFVRQFAGADPDWFAAQAPTRVQEWLAGLTGSQLFVQAMARFVPWVDATDSD